MKIVLPLAASLAVSALSVPGRAAELFVYDFEANTAGPTMSHHGTFGVLYEDDVFTHLGIEFSVGGTTFSQLNTAMNQGASGPWPAFLIIGGAPSGPEGMEGGTNDFWLFFHRDSADLSKLSPFHFAYVQPGHDPHLALGSTGDFTITRVFRDFEVHSPLAPVPEPSVWAMMLIGFGFVGGAMRSVKRRQKLTVSYS